MDLARSNGKGGPQGGSDTFEFDVFISYSHKDQKWVREWLLPRLEGAGLKVCIDRRDFKIGVLAPINMEEAVQQSRKTIFVLTPDWIESEWAEFESLLAHAKDPSGRRQRMLPLLLKDCDLPDRLSILTYADFTLEEDWESEMERVLQTLGVQTESPSGKKVKPIIQPDLVHPYPLQANFTGRVREREALTTWYVKQQQPVYALIAIGGMGKSAVSWVWVLQDLLGRQAITGSACPVDEVNRPEGVLWWSFYDSEARFAPFLDRALAYASGGTIDPRQTPSEHDKVNMLIRLLLDRPILLVLDGFERELRAYAGLDAAYQGDAMKEDAAGSHRMCVDPHAARFLENAASLPLRGRVLITSRLMPRELQGRDGNPLAGCLSKELKGFDPADAVAFFQAEGIKGERAEIERACAPYEYHPLALSLLAGVIIEDEESPREIKVAERHPVTEDMKGRANHHILGVAYDAMDDDHRTLLSRFAAFRNPMKYETLKIFNPYTDEQRFKLALRSLKDRGLLLHTEDLYDLHPIVRQYAYERLTDKEGVHTRLRDHFRAVPMPEDTTKVRRIEDLNPIIELYHHTLRAGWFHEARILFYDRLSKALYHRFGAYQSCIELLSALFPDGEPLTSDGHANLPRIKYEPVQAWIFNELALSYSRSGQSRRAVPLFERHNDLRDKTGDSMNLAIGLGNLANCFCELGRLTVAEENLRRRIALCWDIKDRFEEAIGHRELGRLLAYQGAFNRADKELAKARRRFKRQRKTQSEGVVWCYRVLNALLNGEADVALTSAGRAFEFWHKDASEDYPVERDRVRVEWLLGWALTTLAEQHPKDAVKLLTEAEGHLTEALTRCRGINLVEFEPDILLAWARWHRAKGDAASARRCAEEALSIADRCEYRLKQADIHNFLARLALDAGDKAAAHKEAGIARERAWCDGPPHCYKPALDEAERLLAAT